MVLNQALWITLIGMGLVFVAILLLWGLMALLVRVLAERPAPADEPAASAAPGQSAIPEDALLLARKRRAAAAAVAAALAAAEARPRPRITARPTPASGISLWQAAHRAGQLSRQNYAPRKKGTR
jgi:Na+-transporting methylmalonyl-CoA/oxaloacetate decarboxylase gamma subunit